MTKLFNTIGACLAAVLVFCPSQGLMAQEVELIPAAAVEPAVPAPTPAPAVVDPVVVDVPVSSPEPVSSLAETVVQSAPAPRTTPATVSRPRETTPYQPSSQVISTPSQTPVTQTAAPTVEPLVINDLAPVAIADLPGSGYFVTATEIREQNYTNPNRILARVPGVYVREEDGAGLFPNFSLRGADGTRSEKVTLMEDGILTAPATYAAPSAYYSPNIARMAGVEVLKGSSQVRFGPHTTGGVVNYVSTPIPVNQQFYLRSTIGSDSTFNLHSHYGDTIETAAGSFGYLAEIHYKSSDGFRTIQGGPAIPGGGGTGYEVVEPMIKLSWEPNTILDQRFEFKFGYTDLEADETYLGLSEADVRNNPYRRYAGSFLDNIQAEHFRTYLKHQVDFNENFSVDMMGYYSYFERDWFKIRRVEGQSLHTALLDPTSAAFGVLTGRAGGTLGYRHNARSYSAYGFQLESDYIFEGEVATHTFTTGFRIHHDEIHRFQENTNIITAIGAAPIIDDQGPGSGGNRGQSANAYSVWIQDRVEVGRLAVTPGIRVEHVDQHSVRYESDATFTVQDRDGVPDNFRGDLTAVAPGIGFNFDFDDRNSIYAGVYKGISIPSPSSVLRSGTLIEESLGYELGWRHSSENFNSALGFFHTSFDNLLGQQAGLGGDANETSNSGEATVYGIEAIASYDPWQDRFVRMPVFASATWTQANLEGTFLGGGGEDIYGDGTGGAGVANALLPYIPEYKLALGWGLQTDLWGLNLNATYISDTFGTGLNSTLPLTSSRQGIIDGGWIVDLGAHAELNDRVNMIGGVHNIFDNAMISSRVPEGPRNGSPRQFYVGFEILWEPEVED